MNEKAIESGIRLSILFALSNNEQIPSYEELRNRWIQCFKDFEQSLQGTVCPCMIENEQSTQ